MDRLIYTAMTGASHVLNQQAAVSENMANASTPGYRATIHTFRAVPLVGAGLPTRTFVVDSTAGTDFTPGTMEPTGRELDVAVEGQGWIAVKLPDGREAYTRNGSFQVTPNGILQTRDGFNVVGENGPISIPPNSELSIAKDGTISTVPSGPVVSAVTNVARIKLVNPPENNLVRGEEGLFHTADGSPANADPNVMLVHGNLESSNVNSVDIMVNMITLARQFDMQMKVLQSADNNAKQAGQLLNINA